MNRGQKFTAALALLATSAPAASADLTGQEAPSRLGLFAGGTIRLSLDGRAQSPSARLSLGSYRLSDQRSGAVRRLSQPRGFEFGQGANGKTTLFVGGQPMQGLERRLKLSGSSNSLLWIGGAAAVSVAALLLLSDDNDSCCLDPNLCEPC